MAWREAQKAIRREKKRKEKEKKIEERKNKRGNKNNAAQEVPSIGKTPTLEIFLG